MNKSLLYGLMALGGLLIAGALILAFVIVPSQKIFPDDVDVIRTYELEYLTLLDAETLSFYRAAAGETDNLLIYRHVKVEEVDGDNALVLEDQAIREGDTVLAAITRRHALNRRSMEALSDPPAAWTQVEGYWPRAGLVIGWGTGVEKRDYTAWSDDPRQTVRLEYVDEVTHQGVNTYHFKIEQAPLPITDEHIAVLGLPTTLDIAALGELAGNFDIEDEDLAATVQSLLPILVTASLNDYNAAIGREENSVPLEYAYNFYAEYWVEPVTGVLIDIYKLENRTVSFPEPIMEGLRTRLTALGRDPEALSNLLPLSVSSFAYRTTDESIQDAKDDAESNKSRLNLFGRTLPIGLGVLGLLLILGGGVMVLGSKPQAAQG